MCRQLFTILFFAIIISTPLMRVPVSQGSPLEQQLCPDIVQTAFETTGEVCSATGRNEACYGHVQLDARFHAGYDNIQFSQVGDQVAVESLQALRLSALDENTGAWGVAMMKLQANLPEASPAQNTTLLMFGDVAINDAIQRDAPLTLSVMPTENALLMSAPSRSANRLATLNAWQTFTADGRTEDGRWIRLQTEAGHGWLPARQISHVDDLNQLQVLGAEGVQFKPMQAFYFHSTATQNMCSEVPASGLMIQTPEGAGLVRLWINEVKIELGSTAYIQAVPGQQMVIRMVEGHADVTTPAGHSTAIAGTEVTIPLNANSQPTGAPSLPQAYTAESVQNLPLGNLERPITIAPPLDQNTLALLVERVLTSEIVCGDAPFPACPSVNLDGIVEEIDGTSLTIDGERVVLEAADPLLTRVSVGDHVMLQGQYNSHGHIMAQRLAYYLPPANNASVPTQTAPVQVNFDQGQSAPPQAAPSDEGQPAPQQPAPPPAEQPAYQPAPVQQPPVEQPAPPPSGNDRENRDDDDDGDDGEGRHDRGDDDDDDDDDD